ncbi:MAG TPA: hypothetical protein VK669_11700 [Candidatus Limnocylindrales bacterium]|nr:hypothetical protein [Candidatus Limnocylindrales bacterium]
MAADINKRVTYLREGYDPVDDVDRQLLREMRGHYGVSKRHAGFRKNDPLMLRGFRRAAYDVFAAAGASGLTREEFHARFPEALAPESRARFDASPDRRKLMWEALSYLRNEGVKLGIIVHGPPLGPWTLIRCEPGFTVIPKKRRRSKPK